LNIKIFAWRYPKPFDPPLEELYQTFYSEQFFKPIRLSILIGSIIFFAFAIDDILELEIAPHSFLVRFPISLMGLALWFYMGKCQKQAQPQIQLVAFWVAVIAMGGLLAMPMMAHNIQFMEGFQTGIIILIAYIFGPLHAPVIASLLICIIATLLLLVLGLDLAVPYGRLLEISFDLLIMTFIGTYLGWQLEAFSRQAFLDQRSLHNKRLLVEQAMQDKTELLRNASHNLSQPIQALSSYTSTLEDALAKDNLPLAHQATAKLAGSVDLLIDSFQQILSLSVIDSGTYQPQIAPLAINRTLGKIGQQYSAHAENKGLRLKIILREKPPLSVCTDESVLVQVLGNLVDNAIKYSQQGWVLVNTSKHPNNTLRLHIVDTGRGIAAHQHDNIFKEFVRLDQGPCPDTGIGIGLAYVDKALKTLPGHKLGFYSREDMGSHFYLDMPIATAAIGNTANQEQHAGYILLVDNDQYTLYALAKYLNQLGYHTETAVSAIESKQVLENYLAIPLLVITDLHLDSPACAEAVVRHVHNICGPIPIIVTSHEHADSPPATINIQDQCYPLLKKPLCHSTLVQTIKELLA